MTDTTVDNDRTRVRATERANDDKQPTGADLSEVTKAADEVNGRDVSGQALQTAGTTHTPDTFKVADVNGARSKDNPASFLADTTLSQTQMAERLKGMTTPELTQTVKGVDAKDMGFGKNVTPDGWKALHGEIDRRFSDATKNRDFNNPELAELSRETQRQYQFGDKTAPWSEKSWRELARSDTALARRDDAKAAETYKTLGEANRLAQHRVAGSTPPSEMTNAQLLDKVDGIPGRALAGEFIAATGIPGMLAQAAGESKSQAQLQELQKRMEDGRIPKFDPAKGTDGNVGAALGVATTIAQLGNPKNWAKKGVDMVRGLFKKKGAPRPDVGDTKRITGELREIAAEDGLRKQGFDVRRWNQEFGDTEVDLMMTTGRGRYGVLVGGEAKAMRNGKIDEDAVRDSLEKFRRADDLLKDPDGPFRNDGAGAIMAFPKGTDRRVIDRFIKELGHGRVMTF